MPSAKDRSSNSRRCSNVTSPKSSFSKAPLWTLATSNESRLLLNWLMYTVSQKHVTRNLILSPLLLPAICEVCDSLYFTKTMAQHMQYTLVCNIKISQSSVATFSTCGGNFNNRFVANCLPSLIVKELWKSVNIWRRYGQELSATFFDSRCTFNTHTALRRRRARLVLGWVTVGICLNNIDM